MFLRTTLTTNSDKNSTKNNFQRSVNAISIIGALFASCSLAFGATPLSPSERSAIESTIAYSFSDKSKLDHVFHHNSLPGTTQFQQLEWLGDSLITEIVSRHIYSPDKTVPELQAALESKVSNANFSTTFKNMGLVQFLKFNPATDVNTVASDAFEALVAAIHRDSQTNTPHAARDFVLTKLFGIRPVPIAATATANPIVTITIRDARGTIIKQIRKSNTKIKTSTKQIITELTQQNSINGKKKLETFKAACATKGWTVSREILHPAFSTVD